MMCPIDANALLAFTRDVFLACEVPAEQALIVAEHLVTSNLTGYDTHGVIRIPQYVEDIKKGTIIPGAPVTLESQTETTGIVDGGWNFGQVAGLRAIEMAVERASTHRVAMVVVRRSNHAGRLGAYTQRAAEEGFVALGFCNSPIHGHFVLPWGGREGRLATNPLSFAVPTSWGFPLLADFSTAETSEGGIRLHRNLGASLPNGWIVNASGDPTTNPSDFYGPPRGAILPFGGSKGYRGFALSLLVEILAGLLGGSSVTQPQPGNGLAFLVVNVKSFLGADQFSGLMDELRDYIKSSPPAAGFEEVLLPGEPDFNTSRYRRVHGIPLDIQTREQLFAAAVSVGIAPQPYFTGAFSISK